MRLFPFILLLCTVLFDKSNWSRELSSHGKAPCILDSAITRDPGLFAPSTLRVFYERRNYNSAWSTGGLGDSLVLSIRNAAVFGLIPADYHLARIDDFIRNGNAPDCFELDILLTDAYIKFAFHLRNGRLDKETFTPTQKLTGNDSIYLHSLESFLNDGSLKTNLNGFEPPHLQYQKLRMSLQAALYRYDGQVLTPEDSTAQMSRVLKLMINLERWRWEAPLPSRYLLVNIPAYTLEVIEENEVKLTSRIIVGRPDKQTPILSSSIECFTIYPVWNVPHSIATEEILPQLQKDTTYLNRHHFEVIGQQGKKIDEGSINWTSYTKSNFPFHLRQREGTDNALGVVKFYFPNDHDVYLHDTNDRRLFSREIRALSHGCIRVEKAVALAQYVVDFDYIDKTSLNIQKLIALRKTKEINVKTLLPVLVRYFPADDISLYDDIYSMDPVLSKAFDQAFVDCRYF